MGYATAGRLSNGRAGLVSRGARQHRRRLRGQGAIRSDARLDAKARAALLPGTRLARRAARARSPRRPLPTARLALQLALLAQHPQAAHSHHQPLLDQKEQRPPAIGARAAAFAKHRRDAALERAACVTWKRASCRPKSATLRSICWRRSKAPSAGATADRWPRRGAWILFQGAGGDAAGGRPTARLEYH